MLINYSKKSEKNVDQNTSQNTSPNACQKYKFNIASIFEKMKYQSENSLPVSKKDLVFLENYGRIIKTGTVIAVNTTPQDKPKMILAVNKMTEEVELYFAPKAKFGYPSELKCMVAKINLLLEKFTSVTQVTPADKEAYLNRIEIYGQEYNYISSFLMSI
ncbi:MAG TPA: hypothetical protein PLO51_03125, partial [Candidatus Micrarchaeota archaeon]|nr:hypothetical protein [Candidatus Micrarchaeota archaeon]